MVLIRYLIYSFEGFNFLVSRFLESNNIELNLDLMTSMSGEKPINCLDYSKFKTRYPTILMEF